MKRLFLIALLGCSISAAAVDGKSLLIGIGIGLGLYTFQGTRTHVILPVAHAIQRTIRPIPQDKIDKAARKARKNGGDMATKEWQDRYIAQLKLKTLLDDGEIKLAFDTLTISALNDSPEATAQKTIARLNPSQLKKEPEDPKEKKK